VILYREPPASPIIHGNADIALSMMPEADASADVDVDHFPERDDLHDPALVAASHAYHARLLSSARPVAPEPLS
jgi:hypothetical protein